MVFFTYLFNPLKDDFQFSAIIVIIRCTLKNVRQHLFILWNTSSLRKKKICRISFPRPYFEKLDQSFAFFCVYCTTLVDTLRSHIHSSKIVPFFQDSCCFMLCAPFFLLNPRAGSKGIPVLHLVRHVPEIFCMHFLTRFNLPRVPDKERSQELLPSTITKHLNVLLYSHFALLNSTLAFKYQKLFLSSFYV